MHLARTHTLWSARLVGAVVVLASGTAQAQNVRTTGIFARVGVAVSGFGLDAMTYRLQGRAGGAEPRSFTGKQILLGREWLAGISMGAHVDGPWFYVRVGADLYQNPSALSGYTVRASSLGWISAGPRFSFGAFAVHGGVRVGALLQEVAYRDPVSTRSQGYSGIGAIYALEAGAQWRPLRWLQVDAAIAQDVLGPLTGTTFGLTASVGWSARPSTR